MRYDFFPDREADMVSWGNTFATVLQQTDGHFGVPPATLAEFVLLQQDFAEAYRQTTTPQTRTTLAVVRKNECRSAMERAARYLAKFLSGNENLSDVDRGQLGLTVPKTRTRHVKPPTAAPIVRVDGVVGNRVSVALVDADHPARRARPDTARGAVLLYAVGDHPPAKKTGWIYVKATTKTRQVLALDPALPFGTRIWLRAFWTTRRQETSPWSEPVATLLLGEANLSGRALTEWPMTHLPVRSAAAPEPATQAA